MSATKEQNARQGSDFIPIVIFMTGRKMNQCIYNSGSGQADYARTIRYPHALKGTRPLFLCRPASGRLKFTAALSCQIPERNWYLTTLRFPPEAADGKERQVQKLNYDNFIRVMAEVVQKYAPVFRDEGGNV